MFIKGRALGLKIPITMVTVPKDNSRVEIIRNSMKCLWLNLLPFTACRTWWSTCRRGAARGTGATACSPSPSAASASSETSSPSSYSHPGLSEKVQSRLTSWYTSHHITRTDTRIRNGVKGVALLTIFLPSFSKSKDFLDDNSSIPLPFLCVEMDP